MAITGSSYRDEITHNDRRGLDWSFEGSNVSWEAAAWSTVTITTAER